ncbi:MAG: IS200/IS605 family transposase [Pirellulaceae bacterium]|nr:IS200/IS605 family transposase [Pirellulaceae bacterium]
MAHSYASCLYHCVWSAKQRQRIITPELRERLWPYIGGIAKQNRMKARAIGGGEDHIHVLLSLPSNVSVSKSLQLIKGGSSKWAHDTFPEQRHFSWQEGYGAFSIGITQVDDTVSYIERQAEHHRRRSYQDEFLAFLEKHHIEYDPRYLWD